MLELHFKDNQYPFRGVDHLRRISRGVVLDENNHVAIHEIFRDDMFCKQGYCETPGGGIDEGETPEEALSRECSEEIGYEVEVLCPLCIVHDFYNLIGRENENHFFLARRSKEVGIHHASSGDEMIQRTVWIPIDEAIARYEAMEDTLVSGLVKQRELPVLRLAREEMIRRGLLGK